MSDEAFKLAIVFVTGLPATIGAIAAIVSAVRIGATHTLVNSQYSNLLQRNLEALEKIAHLAPTDDNRTSAAAARQIVQDHRASPG